MSLQSDINILRELREGNIVIEPFDLRHLGTNSYDARIDKYYYQGNIMTQYVHLDNSLETRGYWGEIREAEFRQEEEGYYIPVHPGSTILARTIEVIGGRNGYLADMYSRSTTARSGLSVCRCAGKGDVGYIDQWTMEVSNSSDVLIYIPVGFRICQFRFEYVGMTRNGYYETSHSGNYNMGDPQDPKNMLPQFPKQWDLDVMAEIQRKK